MECPTSLAQRLSIPLQHLQRIPYVADQRMFNPSFQQGGGGGGVTQGDQLSMAFYALSVLPLIRSLKNTERWIQAWYADDANCVGFLRNVLTWFKRLMQDGPAFG